MTEFFPDATPPSEQEAALHWRARFDGEPDSIAAARALAQDFLAELGRQALTRASKQDAGDVLLVVSELVTNAERHAGGPVLLDLAFAGHTLEVTVWDTGTALPVQMPRDPSRIGGHGMEIVARLCSFLHAELVTGGKRVRARMELP